MFPQQLSNRSFISTSTLTFFLFFPTWKETNTKWIGGGCRTLSLSLSLGLLKLTNNTKTYNKTTSTTTRGRRRKRRKKKQVGAVCIQRIYIKLQRRNLYYGLPPSHSRALVLIYRERVSWALIHALMYNIALRQSQCASFDCESSSILHRRPWRNTHTSAPLSPSSPGSPRTRAHHTVNRDPTLSREGEEKERNLYMCALNI